MAIIGYNSIGGSTPNNTNSKLQALTDGASYTYVAAADQVVDELFFYCGTSGPGDGSGVEVGVYNITSGTASAPLVASGTITGLSASTWSSQTITPVALVEGETYAVAFRIVSATSLSWRSTYVTGGVSTSSLSGTSALAGTWTDNGNSGDVPSLYASTSTAASGLTLDSAPSTMAKGETGVSFVVSNPATVPTTGNTTVISAGDSLTVTGVTGSDPYTINCTVPVDISKQAGSSAWTITVDAENVVSASIPLTVQAGWTNLPLVSPLTTSGYMLEGFTGDTPVTGDTMEYETTTDLSPDAASQWIWDTAPTVTQVVARRVIQVDGTVGTTADATFTVSNGDIPVITLSGDNPQTVEAGTSWSEPGYSATDTEDGTITGSVVVAGDTVDVGTLGAYVITYNVTDSDSNPAVQKTRTVNVTDTIIPVVAIIGTPVKEVLLNGAYVELGATATDSFEGTLTGSIVTAGDTVDETTLGSYVVTYDVSDSSGNDAVTKTRTVNVVAGPTPPIISLPTGVKTGHATATGTVTTDEGNGTLYFYATTNSSELLATIKASGSNQSVSGIGVQNVNFYGLSALTTYYAHYVHTDDTANDSNVVSSTSFTTDAAPTGESGILRNVLRSPLKNILRNVLK